MIETVRELAENGMVVIPDYELKLKIIEEEFGDYEHITYMIEDMMDIVVADGLKNAFDEFVGYYELDNVDTIETLIEWMPEDVFKEMMQEVYDCHITDSGLAFKWIIGREKKWEH